MVHYMFRPIWSIIRCFKKSCWKFLHFRQWKQFQTVPSFMSPCVVMLLLHVMIMAIFNSNYHQHWQNSTFWPQPALVDFVRFASVLHFIGFRSLLGGGGAEQGRQPCVQSPTCRSRSPSDRVAQLCPQAPGSLFVAFYDSHGYGGGILTRLHKEGHETPYRYESRRS
jgi:hypothetical protein